MKEPNIKSALWKMIENEEDPQILDAIHTILKRSSSDILLKTKLTSRALKAEKDIREGNTFNRKEVENKLSNRLGI